MLYYAAERRRLVVPFDAALRSEALATLDAAKSCARRPRPMPLINDPRCPRCSLQPICLPDEVNAQCESAKSNHFVRPRHIWPPRDDGIHIVVQNNGTKVGVRGAAMILTDKDGKKLKDIPLAGVESFALLGAAQISTQALHTLADRGIPVAFLSASGRIVAMVDPMDAVSADTRRAQVRQLDQPRKTLELARALVAAKITNQRTLLMRNYSDLPPQVTNEMAVQAERAANAETIDSLLGHEGQAAAIYFSHFAQMINCDIGLEFNANGRQRRPPPDPVNTVLSFAYTMLTHECTAALRAASAVSSSTVS
jgi:CRISPR-associated protein Cas1